MIEDLFVKKIILEHEVNLVIKIASSLAARRVGNIVTSKQKTNQFVTMQCGAWLFWVDINDCDIAASAAPTKMGFANTNQRTRDGHGPRLH